MKHLMLTTALATATAFGAMAQTASEQTPQERPEQTMDQTGDQTGQQDAVPAFLSSDFTGKSLYTLDTDDARTIRERHGATETGGGMSVAERDRMRWTSSDTFLADRDNWTSVGSIDDIVMTKDGEIRGVLLDVGGFLGFGTRTVMVDIEELHFVTQDGAAEDIDDFFVVIAMSQDQLEALPEWEDNRLRAGFETRGYRQQDGAGAAGADRMSDGTRSATGQGMGADSQAMTTDGARSDTGQGMRNDRQTMVFADGDQMIEAEERTADNLMGADVYDAGGEHIGSVQDVVLGSGNDITDVVVDVGGFLGVGTHTVLLPIEDAQIGWTEGDGNLRMQVGMTREQLEALPEYDG